VGSGFCPIFHRDKDKHAPTACPLLAELNLKLIRVSPPAGPPAAAPAPAASPPPGGHSAMADEASTLSSKGSATAPSGLVATVAEECKFNNNFHWDGDKSGVTFSVSSALSKSNTTTLHFTTLHARMLLSSHCLLPWPLLHFVAPTGQSISWRLLPPNALSYLIILCRLLHVCQLH
jgi:hypothetical protein